MRVYGNQKGETEGVNKSLLAAFLEYIIVQSRFLTWRQKMF